MKNKLLLFIAAIFVSLASFAQVTAEDIENKAKAETAKITEGLDLTDNQETLLYRQVYTYVATEMKIEASGDNSERMQKMANDTYTNYIKEVKQILGDDQYRKVAKTVESIGKKK